MPAFAEQRRALEPAARRKTSSSTREPLDTGPPWWQSLLLGFGPTLLFLLLLVLADAPRRRTSRTCSATFGRSRARRYQPSGDRVTFADVAGIDEAKAELTRGRRLPPPPREVPQARRPHPARRAALRARPEPARRCSRGRSRARPSVPFFSHGRLRVRRGDRRRRRLARPRPLRPGEGSRAGDRLHRRARRDRPLAHLRRRPASAAATTSASRR